MVKQPYLQILEQQVLYQLGQPAPLDGCPSSGSSHRGGSAGRGEDYVINLIVPHQLFTATTTTTAPFSCQCTRSHTRDYDLRRIPGYASPLTGFVVPTREPSASSDASTLLSAQTPTCSHQLVARGFLRRRSISACIALAKHARRPIRLRCRHVAPCYTPTLFNRRLS